MLSFPQQTNSPLALSEGHHHTEGAFTGTLVNVALLALQKTFVDFFFQFAWEVCIENGGDFW